jgi:hypothetical protein
MKFHEIARRPSMRTKLAAMTALASSLLFAAAMGANAAPSAKLDTSITSTGLLTLARAGGGGGGHGGGGGGPGIAAGGGAGSHVAGGGGGAGRFAAGGGNAGSFKSGPGPSGHMASRGINRSGVAGPSGSFKGHDHGRYAGNDWRGDHHGHHRHGRFFYGPDVFVYGGNYGDDCGWLYRRAQVTGSPYWWQRYQECIY